MTAFSSRRSCLRGSQAPQGRSAKICALASAAPFPLAAMQSSGRLCSRAGSLCRCLRARQHALSSRLNHELTTFSHSMYLHYVCTTCTRCRQWKGCPMLRATTTTSETTPGGGGEPPETGNTRIFENKKRGDLRTSLRARTCPKRRRGNARLHRRALTAT